MMADYEDVHTPEEVRMAEHVTPEVVGKLWGDE